VGACGSRAPRVAQRELIKASAVVRNLHCATRGWCIGSDAATNDSFRVRATERTFGFMRVAQQFITPARADIVWQVLADVEHWRDWTPTVVEIKPLSNKGLTVGA
jgi:hypothetical protein